METLKAAAFKLHCKTMQAVHDLSHLSIAFLPTSNYIGMTASDTDHQDFLFLSRYVFMSNRPYLESPIATPPKTTALRFLFLYLLLTHNNTTPLTPHHHNASTLSFIITPISHITPMP
jgi:hypothetical protein